jgi:hypothetical protein
MYMLMSIGVGIVTLQIDEALGIVAVAVAALAMFVVAALLVP